MFRFELILRLKGNYLWPAIWSRYVAVDTFADVNLIHSNRSAFAFDDPQSQFLADMYGIVMGTRQVIGLNLAHFN